MPAMYGFCMDVAHLNLDVKNCEKIDVIIEISANSYPVKYELKDSLLRVDRFIPTSMVYPANYGFIPNTIGGDGDPIDVLVMSRFPVVSCAVLSVRPVGALCTVDESGDDVKILGVPSNEIDPHYSRILNYSDFSENELERIVHFFQSYKQLEKGKKVSVGEWKDAHYAQDEISKALG